MLRLTIKEYAELSVRLAHVSTTVGAANPASPAITVALARALQQAGLTEKEWDAESSHWEDELSLALEQEDEVSPLILEYSAAVQAAQNALAGAPLALETFSHILGEVQRGTPLDHVLRQRHISLPEFLSAQRHWMARAAADPEVRLALEAGLR